MLAQPAFTSDGEEAMRGNEKVIEQLNGALCAELTAIVQYMTQSEMCNDWGYKQLGERTKARAIEEMKHAEGLIERIIFLDGTPSVGVGLKPRLGENVQQQMEINLEDELDAVRQYNDAVKVCAEAKDDVSRSLFKGMIEDEERHVDYLEAQVHAIEEIGIANYLAKQIAG
jgi:bacterioferritin